MEAEATRVIVTIVIWTIVIISPFAIADLAFKRPGKEIASNICYLVSGVAWVTAWTISLMSAAQDSNGSALIASSLLTLPGLSLIAITIISIKMEIKKRKRIAVETLF